VLYRSDYVITATEGGDAKIKYIYNDDIYLLLDWSNGEDLLDRSITLEYSSVRKGISLSFDLHKVTHPFTRRILEKISEVYAAAPYYDIYYNLLSLWYDMLSCHKATSAGRSMVIYSMIIEQQC
jgi:hypothetical protein